MRKSQTFSIYRELRYYIWVLLGALGLTLAFFSVLPVMQTITDPNDRVMLTPIATTQIDPPPPDEVMEEPKSEPEPEDAPPELADADPQPLSLDQLAIALDPGFGDGWGGEGVFSLKLDSVMSSSGADNIEDIFSLADLDQKPRVINQPSPVLDSKLRKKTPATLQIIFIVNEKGRVIEPRVKETSNSDFNKSALDAVKKWIFEPGKKSGKAVQTRMLAPITFPKG